MKDAANKCWDNLCEKYPNFKDKDGMLIGNYPAFIVGWIEALEWVLSLDSGFCSCGCPNDSEDNLAVLHQIKKELNNE